MPLSIGTRMKRHTSSLISNRSHTALLVVLAALCCTIIGCPDGGPVDDDAGVPNGTCETFCTLEAECGLRANEACVASSCDGEVRKPSTSDACIADAVDCAEVVLCTCAESCAKIETCTGSTDPACVSTCETLSAQTPELKYVENRCVIESPCEDIAVCSN
jgi:hypothetical protein